MRVIMLLIGLLLSAANLTYAAEIRLATLEYPPYSSQQLAAGGSVVELTTQAFAAVGHRVRIDFLPWARVLAELHKGSYDGILPLWPEEIVSEQLIASRPLFYSEMGLFTRHDQQLQFSDLRELSGQTVGTVRGYGYPASILNSGIVVEEAVDDLTNLRKLAAGRFDLVLLEQQVGLHLINRHPELQGQLVWQGQMLARLPLLVGFVPPQPGQPDWPALYAQGLSRLLANGEYLRILQKHAAAIP